MRCLSILFLIATCCAQNTADLDRDVRAKMNFLASDAMQGRGSATPFEAVAAAYLASEMQEIGLLPAGDGTGTTRSYIQNVPFGETHIVGTPVLQAGDHRWQHGKDIAIIFLSETKFNGPLQKLTPAAKVQKGSVVLLTPGQATDRQAVRQALDHGAAAVLLPFSETMKSRFDKAAITPLKLTSTGQTLNVVALSAEASKAMEQIAEGTPVTFQAESKADQRLTRNVIGVLPGRTDEAITISAHFDHLGVKGTEGDTIYNGADDDASGTIAVLELARALAKGEKLQRTVYFVLFGSEELGGIGSKYFEEHPPLLLSKLIADVQFEMLGRSDPKVSPALLWMTGFERSNLGPTLAAHGALLAADPYPAQNFFERSDNYALAKKGVVAHTISSFALHPQYHQPDDDIAHIDFAHLTRSIQSMIEPIRSFANSDFRPTWNPGKKP